ncbi:MAG: acylneuraminate cytidylyltransferase family protein [Rhodobacteraceae bacterium]|nr:acylneuraminate cytidylyltransferase family protein [Paracoccaceae bacterium]
MIIGHIGVRKGSRGVPGKNFQRICGRPLIDWSLDQLFENPQIDTVVVSTDSEEILEHALKRGCLDIGLRPDHLATDTAAKWDVWRHALEACEAIVGPADIFLDLDATSPLRMPEDVSGALDLFQAERPDMVMSCSISRKNPYFNIVEADASGALHVSKPLPNNVVARQQAPMVYDHVGVVYAVAPDYLRRARALFEGRVIPFVVPNERSLDIDSPLDWEIVEILLGRQIAQGVRKVPDQT